MYNDIYVRGLVYALVYCANAWECIYTLCKRVNTI
jgi:hypothetical protein